MKSVDVFCGVDGHQDFLCIHLRRQRQLHQDAVDIVAAIEIVDQNQQVLGGCRFGRRVLLAIDAELFAGADAILSLDWVDLAGALRSGHGQRTAVCFYGIAFDVTALTFNAVWQYARGHGLLSDALDSAGATAISRRFQLALAWLTTGALLGAVLPVLGVVVIAAFNAFYWLPIRGESPRPRPS